MRVVFLKVTFFAAPLFTVVFSLVGADFLGLLGAAAFFLVAAGSLTRKEAFLEALDFLVIAAAGLTVFAFVVAKALSLGARVVTLPAGFLAVVAFVTAFEASFLEGGFVF